MHDVIKTELVKHKLGPDFNLDRTGLERGNTSVNLYSTSWDQVSTWTAPDWTTATLTPIAHRFSLHLICRFAARRRLPANT
jgi:hypothetical protein